MLYNSFLMVKDKCNTYFGGNQAWCDKKYMQKSGCGVVGCANFILHQGRTAAGLPGAQARLRFQLCHGPLCGLGMVTEFL